MSLLAGLWLQSWSLAAGQARLLPVGWLVREDLEGWTNPSLLPGGWLALGWILVGILKPLYG